MPTADNTSAMTAKTVNIVPKTRWPHRDCSIHVSSGMRRHTTDVGFDGLHLGSDDGWRALKIGAPNQQHPGNRIRAEREVHDRIEVRHELLPDGRRYAHDRRTQRGDGPVVGIRGAEALPDRIDV